MSCPTFVSSFFTLLGPDWAALSVELGSECLYVQTFAEIRFWRAEECCSRNVLLGHLKLKGTQALSAAVLQKRRSSTANRALAPQG